MQTPLKKVLSPARLRRSVAMAWRRFPAALVFLGAFVVAFLCAVHTDAGRSGSYAGAVAAGCFMGFSLSAAAVIFSEQTGRRTLIPQLSATLVSLVLIAIYCNDIGSGAENMYSLFTASAAIWALAFAGVFFIPPFITRADAAARHTHTDRVIYRFITAIVLGIILSVFILILAATLRILFGLDFDSVCIMDILLIFGLAVPCLYFVCTLPRPGIAPEVPGRIAPIAKNVLLPLAAVYMTVLCAYALKILADWELPKAPIVWMVSGLLCVLLLTLYGLQGYLAAPSVRPAATRIASIASRWLPLIMLAPLALMSVAIIYRIAQYGFSTPRAYVLVFNVWAYAAMFVIALRRDRPFNLIAYSFAILFMAVSVIPGFNFCAIRVQEGHAPEIIEVYDTEGEEIEEIINIEAPDAPLALSAIPAGFSTIEAESVRKYIPHATDGHIAVSFDDGNAVTYSVPVDSLRAVGPEGFVPVLFIPDNDGSQAFLLTGYLITYDSARDSEPSAVYLRGYRLRR